jgi:hypothetical protein
MGLAFSWWGVPGVLALVAGVTAAVLALRTAPNRSINRRLAVVLTLDGLFLEARRLEVYRAALEGATLDGVITGKERAILERLRSELGIGAEEARHAEREFPLLENRTPELEGAV